jgi:UDP-GlcNAc3NAcA epimerase
MQVELQKKFTALTLHTGQHYDANMSDVFFKELNIPKPDFLLDLPPTKGQGAQTALMMIEIEKICEDLVPDAILIYGDTNSTLAGALVAAKLGIRIIHIEAGLRSFNRSMPEEINRIVADTFADTLFCPTKTAIENLKKEGITHDGIFLSGDVMCDMLRMITPKLRSLKKGSYYFATIHRPYNTDDPARMKRILETFNALEHPVVFAMHPRTKYKLEEAGISTKQYSNIGIVPPASYVESISYQANAECIITDSGGVQKEAYMLKRKCITLRSETEWVETLNNGWNTLVFDSIEDIQNIVKETPGEYVEGIYGNGYAAAEITEIISERFKKLTAVPA